LASAKGARIDLAFSVINQMVADGVIEKYAIGGATGAFFYIEPDFTYDVDVFCVLSVVETDAIVSLSPIYRYLESKGYKAVDEAVDVEGVAVQFLPVFNPLNEEAVEQAREFDYQGVPVCVMSPEHLMAIMLQTGRSKDYVRVARFLDSQAFDDDALKIVLTQHGLDKQWNALLAVKKRLVK
jgi:hypothetical protein